MEIKNFKTSYVTVYLFAILRVSAACKNFKTSYVTVYLKGVADALPSITFQNIVCYCLSEAAKAAKADAPNFKTSYVTVYQGQEFEVPYSKGFQNIVCYCLSEDTSDIDRG